MRPSHIEGPLSLTQGKMSPSQTVLMNLSNLNSLHTGLACTRYCSRFKSQRQSSVFMDIWGIWTFRGTNHYRWLLCSTGKSKTRRPWPIFNKQNWIKGFYKADKAKLPLHADGMPAIGIPNFLSGLLGTFRNPSEIFYLWLKKIKINQRDRKQFLSDNIALDT